MAALYEYENGKLLEMHSLFHRWREEGTLTDFIVITSDDRRFSVHKCYVSYFSEYFCTLFTGSLHSECADSVHLKNINAQDFAPVLDYIYGKPIEFSKDPDELRTITYAASYLQVTTLLKHIGDHMIKTITADNCLEYNALVEIYDLDEYRHETNLENLTDKINEIAMKYQEMFIKAGKTYLLPVNVYRHSLKVRFASESCEMAVYNDICDWLFVHYGRLKYAAVLMEEVRFPLMSAEELHGLMSSDTHVASNEKVLERITYALGYVTADMPQKMMMHDLQTTLRTDDELFLFGGQFDDQEDTSQRCAVFHDRTWLQLPDLPSIPYSKNPAVTSIRGFVVVCGGWSMLDGKDVIASDVHCFDPRSWTWGNICSMNKGRVQFPVVGLEDKLYAIGGLSSVHKIRDKSVEECDATIDCYDPDTDTWSVTYVLDAGLRDHRAAVVEDSFYVFGGFSSSGVFLNNF